MTNINKKLTDSELAQITGLNSRQIIDRYPEYVKRVLSYSNSVTAALRVLGVTQGNTHAHKSIKKFAKDNGIVLPVYVPSTDILNSKTLTKEIVMSRLIKSDKHQGSALRIWIRKFDLLPYTCAITGCPNKEPIFMGKPFEYDLDHINGDNTDNRIENLRFLCPMCHSQTPTYRGRNAQGFKSAILQSCKECGEDTKLNGYCHFCLKDESVLIKAKAETSLPSIEELCSEIAKTSIFFVSKKYFIDRKTLVKIVENPDKYATHPIRKNSERYPTADEINKSVKNGLSLKEVALSLNLVPAGLYNHVKSEGHNLDLQAEESFCICGVPILSKMKYCEECYQPVQKTKIVYPPIEELTEKLNNSSFESVAKELGVTSNAIRKYLKARGIVFEARRRPNGTFTEKDYLCICGNSKKPISLQCNNCRRKDVASLSDSRLPDASEVVALIKENGITKVAQQYFMPRKTIYAFLTRHGFDYKNL